MTSIYFLIQILQGAAETDLGIIYNCARNYSLPGFYLSRFSWGKILCRWEHSPNAGLRITCKLLGSILRPALLDEEQVLLDLASSDLLSLLEALEEATKSEDATAEAFGYKYSTLELLQILEGASIREKNLDTMAKPQLLVSLSQVIHSGRTTEVIASLKLLWSLLEKEDIKRDFKVIHRGLVEYLSTEMNKSQESDLTMWSKGVIFKVLDSITKGMSFLSVYITIRSTVKFSEHSTVVKFPCFVHISSVVSETWCNSH